jgi:hypothetical protein
LNEKGGKGSFPSSDAKAQKRIRISCSDEDSDDHMDGRPIKKEKQNIDIDIKCIPMGYENKPLRKTQADTGIQKNSWSTEDLQLLVDLKENQRLSWTYVSQLISLILQGYCKVLSWF